MPQPIDPMTELGRVTATERIQQIADRASLAAQSRSAALVAHDQLMAESQVGEMEEKKEEVDRDLRRRNPYMGRRKKKGATGVPDAQHTFYNAEEKPEIVDDPDDHALDVTI